MNARSIKKAGNGKSGSGRWSLWLAANERKRWGELFSPLFYTPFWLTLCLGIVVTYKLYEADHSLPWKDRYWVKASLWIVIFSYVGITFGPIIFSQLVLPTPSPHGK